MSAAGVIGAATLPTRSCSARRSRPMCCGARVTCDSSAATFIADLTQAIADTGATLAFDAIGGGKLAGQILGCIEAVQSRSATEYSRYGSSIHKQVYIYGGLVLGPIVLDRNFGFAWSVSGWLLWALAAEDRPGG